MHLLLHMQIEFQFLFELVDIYPYSGFDVTELSGDPL